VHSSIIRFSFSVYHSLWVWTYSSDDCACHLAMLALGGSAPASPVQFDLQATRNDRKARSVIETDSIARQWYHISFLRIREMHIRDGR